MCGMKVGNWLTHSEVPTIRRPRWLLPALLTFCHFLRNARQPSTETSMQFPFRLRILTYLINARRNELARRRAKLIEILGKCFCSEERKKKIRRRGERLTWCCDWSFSKIAASGSFIGIAWNPRVIFSYRAAGRERGAVILDSCMNIRRERDVAGRRDIDTIRR